MQLTVELYEILQNVDKTGEHLRFLDPISDFLYPLKFQASFMAIIILIKLKDLTNFVGMHRQYLSLMLIGKHNKYYCLGCLFSGFFLC